MEVFVSKSVLFLFSILLLIFACATSEPNNNNFRLDERYEDNGSLNGNHTIVYFSGNISTLNEIRRPLLRGFEQAHIIAKPDDNLIVLFVDERMNFTLYFTERDFYLSFINGSVSESEFIQYVSTRYIIQ